MSGTARTLHYRVTPLNSREELAMGEGRFAVRIHTDGHRAGLRAFELRTGESECHSACTDSAGATAAHLVGK